MEYSEVIAAMFEPSPEGAVSPATVDASPARRLRDAIEPLAMHPVWSRTTNERLAALGLDFMTGYVGGRAAALGEPEPSTVVSAFAVFEPSMLSAVYQQAAAVCERDLLVQTRTEATTQSLEVVLAGHDVGAVADVLRTAVEGADLVGRPLFAGLRDRAWPDSSVGRLWHACEMIREHRGDSHVAACVERGLNAIEMNILTELWVGMPLFSYTASRGWSEDTMHAAAESLRARSLLAGDTLSAEGQRFRSDLEAATDRAQRTLLDGIGEELDGAVAQLAEWSALCIAATAFPPNVFKRAAG